MNQSLLNEVVDYVERGSTFGSAALTLKHRGAGVSFEYVGVAFVDGTQLTVAAHVRDVAARPTGAALTIDLAAARRIHVDPDRNCVFELGDYDGVLTFDGESSG